MLALPFEDSDGWHLAEAGPRSRGSLSCMVGAALFVQRPDIALGLLIQFLCYLHPGELVGLKRGQVIAPQSASFTSHRALLPAPEEDVVTSKTKGFDESVLTNWPELWGLHRFLRRHVAPLSEHDAMWTFDHKEYYKMFARVSELAEVNKLAPHPYSLRHGGASHDSLLRRRSLEAIQKRGRWRAASSATRYDKHARVLKEVSKLGRRARHYVQGVRLQEPQRAPRRLEPDRTAPGDAAKPAQRFRRSVAVEEAKAQRIGGDAYRSAAHLSDKQIKLSRRDFVKL